MESMHKFDDLIVKITITMQLFQKFNILKKEWFQLLIAKLGRIDIKKGTNSEVYQ